MTDEYDPEVNVLPMIAAIRCFGESITEPKGKAVPGDYRITFGRLLVCCADGMHMDSLNGTLKRVRVVNSLLLCLSHVRVTRVCWRGAGCWEIERFPIQRSKQAHHF